MWVKLRLRESGLHVGTGIYAEFNMLVDINQNLASSTTKRCFSFDAANLANQLGFKISVINT